MRGEKPTTATKTIHQTRKGKGGELVSSSFSPGKMLKVLFPVPFVQEEWKRREGLEEEEEEEEETNIV